MRKYLCSLSTLVLLGLFPAISFGQVRPLVSGDRTIWTSYIAKQEAGPDIVFVKKGGTGTYQLQIDQNGDRKFLKPDGYVYYANDKLFTLIMVQNKSVEPERRLVRFPPGKQLQPGMKWDAPPWLLKTACGDMSVKYMATSDNGPDFSMVVNGKNIMLKTIRINYEAAMPRTCEGDFPWRRTQEVLYAPALNDLISSKTINWSPYGPTTKLDSGNSWAITAIMLTPEVDASIQDGTPPKLANAQDVVRP